MLATKFGAQLDIAPGVQGFHMETNHVRIDAMGVSYCRHGAEFDVEYPESDTARYWLCLAGHSEVRSAGHQSRIGAGMACITSAQTRSRLSLGLGLEQLVLRISGTSLRKKLEAITGTRLARDIEFEPTAHAGTPETESLHRAIDFLVTELRAGASATSTAARELEQLVLTLLLQAGRHNFSHLLRQAPEAIEPWQVRLAEEYIEANSQRPITVELLAEALDVSARSLFDRFRSYRGYSPMAFVRRVRLNHAKKMLLEPDASTSVTGVAMLCGFVNQGHFSRYYNAAFGELPSATLSRSRSLSKR